MRPKQASFVHFWRKASMASLAPSLEEWLTANTLPDPLRGTLLANNILSLEELTELEDAKVQEISKTIKLVQGKKFINKCKELRDGAEAALFVPPEVILLGTEEATSITILKHQLRVEQDYLQRMVDFKTDLKKKISSSKAQTVLNISHSEHQDRVGRIRQIISTKMKNGIKDSPEVVTPTWNRGNSDSKVRFEFGPRPPIFPISSPPTEKEDVNEPCEEPSKEEKEGKERETSENDDEDVPSPLVTPPPQPLVIIENSTFNPLIVSSPPITLEPSPHEPIQQHEPYSDPNKDSPSTNWFTSIFCCAGF